VETMKDSITQEKLPKRGSPKAYRLKGAPGPDCHTATNTSEAVQDSVPLVAVQSCQGDEAIPWPTAAGPVFMSATPPTPAPAKLPPHLARLVEEARAGALPVNTFKLQDGNMIPNPTEYVLDWAKAFPGDNANILSKLQSVYDSLSGGAK